jgi:class 3 adenylate cyclase
MPLSSSERARLPDRAFAYVDSKGDRRLPINDASHVRNALARFEQVTFESDAARERARLRLINAAKKYGIMPIGFFGAQLRKERQQGEIEARSASVASLPRGTLTFLFTDIEGSTALLRALGDDYAAVLRTVRSLIRASVRRHGGHEVDARADEFFAVFEDNAAAVAAALAMQAALAARRWPGGRDVRVRIGVHRGRSSLTETGYVGIAVNTAVRVCAAARGGQILLSSAARSALDGEGFVLRSRGKVALKGLAAPETLYQVMPTATLPARASPARRGRGK